MGSRRTGGRAATDDETRRARARIVEDNIQWWWGKGNEQLSGGNCPDTIVRPHQMTTGCWHSLPFQFVQASEKILTRLGMVEAWCGVWCGWCTTHAVAIVCLRTESNHSVQLKKWVGGVCTRRRWDVKSE